MSTTSNEMRNRALETLTSVTYDLLVIGGGIVGAGIARDAALRGLKVALIEQHDFAFGTSSRSSRLLHGGLRYLAQGRIGLVREASIEKKVIHRIAPHLAEPLAFVFPTYRDNRSWVLWQLKLGVKIYDLLCGGQNFGRSTWLTPFGALAKIPFLRSVNLTGAVRYFDAITNDARLTLDTIRSAARAGAVVVNYCRFRDATRCNHWVCHVEDGLANRTFEVRTKAVANATGPWADKLPHSGVKLRVTKGIHVVIRRARLPVPEAVVMHDADRILFAIPWGERVILGTTDTDYAGSPEEVFADQNEIQYVLGVANRFFPRAKLSCTDVISTWAGLRPLIADSSVKPSDVSRSHEICNPEPGWWDVAGGKLTTYRLMAEQTVDCIVREQRFTAGPCRTALEPLVSPEQSRGVSGLLPPDFDRRIVEHFVTNEWALHLDDVMIRRTSWHYYLADAGLRAKVVADWMGELLGWDKNQRREELERYYEATGLAKRVGRLGMQAAGSGPTVMVESPGVKGT